MVRGTEAWLDADIVAVGAALENFRNAVVHPPPRRHHAAGGHQRRRLKAPTHRRLVDAVALLEPVDLHSDPAHEATGGLAIVAVRERETLLACWFVPTALSVAAGPASSASISRRRRRRRTGGGPSGPCTVHVRVGRRGSRLGARGRRRRGRSTCAAPRASTRAARTRGQEGNHQTAAHLPLSRNQLGSSSFRHA